MKFIWQGANNMHQEVYSVNYVHQKGYSLIYRISLLIFLNMINIGTLKFKLFNLKITIENFKNYIMMLLILFIFSPAERTVLNQHFCEVIPKTVFVTP